MILHALKLSLKKEKMAKIIAVVEKVSPKTIVATRTILKRHKLYGKQFRVSKKFIVHDPQNSAHVNDIVEINDTKPVSKRKKWQVVEIIKKA